MKAGPVFKTLILASLLCGGYTPAETVFKWTDQNGVVNYTTTPPSGAGKLTVVNAAPSVESHSSAADEEARYWRERRLREAARESREWSDAQSRRESEDLRQRQVRQDIGLRTQAASAEDALRRAAYEQCLRERRVDCDRLGGSYAPYYPAPVLALRRSPQSIQQAAPFPLTGTGSSIGIAPGTIAGTQAQLGARSTPSVGQGYSARIR